MGWLTFTLIVLAGVVIFAAFSAWINFSEREDEEGEE